jgi:hypothetical protein
LEIRSYSTTGGPAPSRRINGLDQFDKSRLRTDRQVIDHIIDKIRPKKKKKD